MITPSDARTTPPPGGSTERLPEAAQAPAGSVADPAMPAVRPVADRGSADGMPPVEAPSPARPTVPQEDLEEVPGAISPFGPS